MSRTQEWWDHWFLGLAEYVSTASRDPSTKVGCVIVDKDRRIVSMGYNGFAKGVLDNPCDYDDRAIKDMKVIHAETNAVLFARRDLTGCTIYTYPFGSCAKCASLVIQNGITKTVAHKTPDHLLERWSKSVEIANEMFTQAGVDIVRY